MLISINIIRLKGFNIINLKGFININSYYI